MERAQTHARACRGARGRRMAARVRLKPVDSEVNDGSSNWPPLTADDRRARTRSETTHNRRACTAYLRTYIYEDTQRAYRVFLFGQCPPIHMVITGARCAISRFFIKHTAKSDPFRLSVFRLQESLSHPVHATNAHLLYRRVDPNRCSHHHVPPRKSTPEQADDDETNSRVLFYPDIRTVNYV